ncbi:MAG: methyltransferase domain-containing protein [Bacteroidota bacterium]
MKRNGTFKPTIEDAIEIGGIEILHPGGYKLTQRTAELCKLKPGLKVLDVSSGRGTQSIYYAQTYGVEVIGLDISKEMIDTATHRVKELGLEKHVKLVLGDSQNLPFTDNSFDVVINECAVGIPDDSQKVLNEMLRVVKKGGTIAIHESTWRCIISDEEKQEIAERYGTTPLEFTEWIEMLSKAGATDIISEFDEWSKPEMFWKIRKDRDVKHWFFTMTIREKLITMSRIFSKYGLKGIFTIMKNERIFYKTILSGKLGYALFIGEKTTK